MKDREEKITDEQMVQRVINLDTGKDITGEYINQRLKELEKIADLIIDKALQDFRKDHNKKAEIYEESYWQIHEKLGMGSIGPATALEEIMENIRNSISFFIILLPQNLVRRQGNSAIWQQGVGSAPNNKVCCKTILSLR